MSQPSRNDKSNTYDQIGHLLRPGPVDVPEEEALDVRGGPELVREEPDVAELDGGERAEALAAGEGARGEDAAQEVAHLKAKGENYIWGWKCFIGTGVVWN